MGYAIGTLTKDGGDDVHYQLLALLKTICEANGWTTLRYDTTTDNHELILQGEGLSGTEEIFIGFQTYQNTSSDYYNINAMVCTSYIPELEFGNQPGSGMVATPAHNNELGYFISVNAQRVVFSLRIAGAAYDHIYAGKFLPYAYPTEYPLPLAIGGTFSANQSERYSETDRIMPYRGYYSDATDCRGYVRTISGSYARPTCNPYTLKNDLDGFSLLGEERDGCLVPLHGNYQLLPIIMSEAVATVDFHEIWGEYDGVYGVSGFSNGSENVIQEGGSSVVDQTNLTISEAVDAILAAGGRAYIVLQNVYRNTWADFIALEMK